MFIVVNMENKVVYEGVGGSGEIGSIQSTRNDPAKRLTLYLDDDKVRNLLVEEPTGDSPLNVQRASQFRA